MFSLFLSFPLLLVVLAAPLASAQDLRAAAECVSASKRCTAAQSDASGLCKPTVYVTRQPDACIANACNYCYAGDNWSDRSLCRTWGIRRWCYGGDAPLAPGRPAGLPSIAQRKRVGLAASSSPGRRRERKARASGPDRREGKLGGNGRRPKGNERKPNRNERKPNRNELKPNRNELKPNRKGPKPNRKGRKPSGKAPQPSEAGAMLIEEGAMLNENVTPIEEDRTSDEEKSTPDEKDLMLNEENPVANEEDLEPSAEASMPGVEGSMPSAGGSMPSTESSMPSAEGSMPSTEDSMPSTESSMPSAEGSKPSAEGSMPSAEGSMPSTESSMPSAEGSMPSANNSMTNKTKGEPSEEGRQRRRWGRRPSQAALMPKETKGGPSEKGRNPRQEGRKPRNKGRKPRNNGRKPSGKAPVPNGVGGNSTMVQDKQGEEEGEKAPRSEVVLLCMANVKPRSFWTQRDDGLIWRKDEADMRDEPGQGEICKTFRVPSAGTYFVTAVTSAPRRSDNNDMFIKLMSGLRRYHARTHNFHSAGIDYFKGYQNEGGGVKSGDLFSVDNNPHVFVSTELPTGRSHTLCISGRSSRFTVYKVLLVKCEGEGCRRNAMRVREAASEAKKGSCTWDSAN